MGRYRFSRVSAVLLALALVAVLVSVGKAWWPDTGKVKVAEAPDSVTAVRAARLQGSPVVAQDQTTPTRLVRANPDGSMTAEVSMRPTRVRRGAGWADIDTTLARRPDGLVGPRTTTTDLAFSGGGSAQPMVRYGTGRQRIELFWPGRLPVPTLEGRVATYANVLPGVDLEMGADSSGYTQHLVVRTAKAARNPAVRRVALTLRTQGVGVKVTKSGGLEARDKAKKVLFAAPPSLMSDSSGHGDVPGRSARVKVELTGSKLVLTPDRRMLADPATRFPVIVDPRWDTWGNVGWTTIYDGSAGLRASTHWNGYNTQVEDRASWLKGRITARVGHSSWESPVITTRSYWQFDTGWLAGKRIMEAKVNATIVYGPSCGNWRDHQLFLADGAVGDGTSWNNAPWGQHIATASVDNDYTNCRAFKAVGFGVPADKVRAGGLSTYFIKAADEGDNLSWRKYDQNETKLQVRYNTRPNAPYEMRTDPPLPAPCKWCEGKVWFGDDAIRFQTRLNDPEGDDVRPIWDIYGGPQTVHREDGYQGSGAQYSTELNLTDRNGQYITWTVWGSDGTDGGPWSEGPGRFTVDTVNPVGAPKVTARLYEENRWRGGEGVPDRFTFEPTGGDTDIDHYAYGWGSPLTGKADADKLGGPATVELTPPGDGPQDLLVESVDRAGNHGPRQTFHFYVRAGNGPSARWAFEGNAKDDAFLGDRDGTLSGNAKYSPGAVGTALDLDGEGGHMSAPTTVRTGASFSVSAWVNLADRPDFVRTVVAQDGDRFPGFGLFYRHENGGKWVFTMDDDSGGYPGVNSAWSDTPAKAGVWTHLAGVYDATAKKVKLYVDGELSGTADYSGKPPWPSTGPLQVGQTMWDGHDAVSFWKGRIDEVQVYDRTLTDAEVKAAVGNDNVQLGHWKLDEASSVSPGTTAVNEVAGGADMVLGEGAAFVKDGIVGGAAELDGDKGRLTTPGPVLRSGESFSVAAWVTPKRLADPDKGYTFLSQEGTKNSGLWLQQRDGRWLFGIMDGEQEPKWSGVVMSPPGTAQAGVPAHVAGVYDARAQKVWIIVNGVWSYPGTVTGSWKADGPFMVGGGKWSTYQTDSWPGLVDDVRAYNRPLSNEELTGIVSRGNVTAGSYKFDGNAEDAVDPARNGTLSGNPPWAAGHRTDPDPKDQGVNLDGVNDYVTAPARVDTSQSFSTSAWVKLNTKPAGWAAVVSQSGEHTTAYNLGFTGGPNGKWAFAMHGPDTDNVATASRVASTAQAQVGVWTHLVGVYDALTGEQRLYVNGLLANSGKFTAKWNATKELVIGRAKWNSQWIDYLPGVVDDVNIYPRTLFTGEIRALAGRDLSLVHNWRLDEPDGRTTSDAVGGQGGQLSGGAAFAPGRVGNAVQFNDADAQLSTPGVDVAVDKSFTVSSWVYLDSKQCPQKPCRADAVTLDGEKTSKFRLGHLVDNGDNVLGAWVFEMPESDADNAQVTKAAVSVEPSDVKSWVLLTGVYDAPTKKIWLYVNGERIGDGTLDHAWTTGKGLRVGRGKVNGAPANRFTGRVDDVRLYTGALTTDRVSALYASYPPKEVAGPATLPVADAGYWKFDEPSGATAADSSGRGNTVTLKNGAERIGGRDSTGMWLNGTSSYAETAGPILDTTKSFSVAAWAYMTDPNGYRTVLGQDGDRVSAFLLQYDQGQKKWAVVVPSDDKDNPPSVILRAPTSTVPSTWNHLAVTYDAPNKILRLYVNGVQIAAQGQVTTFKAGGPLSIGRSKWNGVNADFFPRGIDDVRLYTKVLSDGEVRKVHDDVYAAIHGSYVFDDGTARDWSWRKDDATASGGVSYVPGIRGKSMRLDGTSGFASTTSFPYRMSDSFTMSAWARLSRDDKVATVIGQDGERMSGFQLQYRPKLKRWTFGAPEQDSDGAPLVHAVSQQPAKVGQWTYLSGVYDFAAGQLRIYVDGELAGTKDGVSLWNTNKGLTIGRGKVDGKPADFFPGDLDEVRVDMGVSASASIAQRAAWPKPLAGQLGRFVNSAGDHYSGLTSAAPRDGYHFEGTLGMPVPAGTAGTRMLYACKIGDDIFTSAEAECEGRTRLGEVGTVYDPTQQPTGIATIPIYRCNAGADHFESRRSDCEGVTNEGLLGYTIAYAPAYRSYRPGDSSADHWSGTDGTPPGYYNEGPQGFHALTAEPGTRPLMSCMNGTDQFVSTDPNCEGKTVLASTGRIWDQPPAGLDAAPVYRCAYQGESYVSLNSQCEGWTVDKQLGYTIWKLPAAPAGATSAPPDPAKSPPDQQTTTTPDLRSTGRPVEGGEE